MTPESVPFPAHQRRYPAQPSRRDVLRIGAVGAASALAAGALSACKASNPSSPAHSLAPVPSLTPFDPSVAAGPATKLPRRLAWSTTSPGEFFTELGEGMQSAATERGCQYLTAVSGNDTATNVGQLDSFVSRGVGALALQPLDQSAQATALESALRAGVCVQGIITHPCTLQIAASQYRIGYDQGVAAARYVRTRLGGRAAVHYFNLDTISTQLKLRHRGVLDGLRTGGSGIRVVSDLTVTDITVDKGFDVMNTVLQAHPDVRVVLGGDTLVVGAYRAIQQAGSLSDEWYLSGVDGDADALELVAKGTPYRASTAFAWQLMGYGMGQFGADWVEGRSIPRVIVAKGLPLTTASAIERFRADNAEPARVFAQPQRYAAYLPLLGNISHATRQTVWQLDYTPR